MCFLPVQLGYCPQHTYTNNPSGWPYNLMIISLCIHALLPAPPVPLWPSSRGLPLKQAVPAPNDPSLPASPYPLEQSRVMGHEASYPPLEAFKMNIIRRRITCSCPLPPAEEGPKHYRTNWPRGQAAEASVGPLQGQQ